MKFGVIVFPGSNCDHDAYHVISKHVGQPVDFIWHRETSLAGYDAVILPGGFSYGDYLRAGALARFSPIMHAVKDFAKNGGFVLGICNGFQILCESGLLPGALIRNAGLNFICRHVNIRLENNNTPFTHKIKRGSVLSIPIAHAEGNYVCDSITLQKLEENNQIVFRYCDETGEVTAKANPNGAISNIAGITNLDRNVLGMMPHPERACEELLGSSDGLGIFGSLVESVAKALAA
ncbi:MAG TPA: phosphoribosylformylglycinamidine synthase subunit PurQ [Pyrinomonadaceae bacterium]|jgi:phosphoribosylformylglycinamidine synthase|nr:phosphoribosylformylglycinamidine synthase subunit PurQ [Pyrinomonadaceae bacterium]